MSGFFLMHRGWRDNPIFRGEYSRADAWVWLIEHAAWKPARTRIKGEAVSLERGELSFSVRFLAEAWGWSKSRVDRFLADLKAENMIETRSKTAGQQRDNSGTTCGTTRDHKAGQGATIITICNYSKYQDETIAGRDNSGTTCGTPHESHTGQKRDEEEQENNRTRVILDAEASSGGRGVEDEGGNEHDLFEPASPQDPAEPGLKPDHVVESWNVLAKKIGRPCVRELTPERRTSLKARIAGYSIDDFRQVLASVERSPFLRGERNWSGVTFDWIIKKNNFLKILEGNYDG